jgi:PAS domain S-box-containing protein
MQSEESSKFIIDNIPVGILLVSIPDLKVIDSNPAATALLDIKDQSSIKGRKLSDLLPGMALRGVIGKLLNTVSKGERFILDEYEHSRHWRGVSYWKFEALSLTKGESPTEILISIIDISKAVIGRRRIERLGNEAQERAAELEAIISQMAEGVMVIDSKGRVLSINRRGAEILGVSTIGVEISNYTRIYNLYKPDGELLSDNELPFVRALQSGETLKDAEVMLRPPDGSERVISINAAPLRNSEGKITGAVALFHDVTDRIRSQQILEQNNERLREVDKLKTRFISTVSHELRTPLNAIIGLVQLLQRDKNEPLTSAQLDMVSRIASNSKQLMMLINDLLDYSRLASGKEMLNLKQFSASELIDQAWISLIDIASTKGLECTKEIHDLDEIESDYTKCYQVLTNILGNAIKYTQQGKVYLRAYKKDEDFWSLEVKDTGPGIPSEDLESIFDEFRRGRDAETGKVVGTGLGLPISRKMVELMGGTIEAESSLGKGSLFRVTWPINVSKFVSSEIIAGRNN